ncbi:MAG TPA: AI-2E family transporter [Stellaceae bacterium]|nr:AI-2E family transporter [Stellaceae bacterium]
MSDPRPQRFEPPVPQTGLDDGGHGAALLRTRFPISRTLVHLAVLALAVLFVWLTLPVDLVIFAGVILAICLRRAAEGLCRLTGIGVGWGIGAILLLALAALAAFGWFFAQQIAAQIDLLSQQLPAAFQKLSASVVPFLDRHFNLNQMQTSPMTVVKDFFGAATNIVEILGAAIMILFLGLYFAVEAELYRGGALRLVPRDRRERTAEIMHEAASAIWYWMLGRFFSMTVLGALTALGLWLIGVPAPVALGLLSGILTFVPYLGAFVSAIPSVILAAAVNLHLAIYVVVLYVGIHVVEGYVLVPLVQRKVVHLPPALALSNQVILGVLAGFFGILLATPLLAAAIVVVRMAYVEDALGDRSDPLPSPAHERQ